MSQSVTIELPEDLIQRLEAFASSADMPLPAFILKALSPFAEIALSLENEDPLIRTRALRQLDTMDRETVTPVLVKALQDSNLIVRGTAADVLRKLSTLEPSAVLEQDTFSIQKAEDNHKENDPLSDDFDTLLALAGTLDIGTTDLGENHDRYIAEALEQELLPDE